MLGIFRKSCARGALTLLGAASVFGARPAHAQNRVDLDDLNIKGELLNDNRLRMSSREMQKITDRVSYRENFRKEITDGLEVAWPEEEAAAQPSTGANP